MTFEIDGLQLHGQQDHENRGSGGNIYVWLLKKENLAVAFFFLSATDRSNGADFLFFIFLKRRKKSGMYTVPLPRGNWFHMTALVPTSAGRGLKWLPHALLKCLKGKERKQERRGKTKLSQPQTRPLTVFWVCFILFLVLLPKPTLKLSSAQMFRLNAKSNFLTYKPILGEIRQMCMP